MNKNNSNNSNNKINNTNTNSNIKTNPVKKEESLKDRLFFALSVVGAISLLIWGATYILDGTPPFPGVPFICLTFVFIGVSYSLYSEPTNRSKLDKFIAIGTFVLSIIFFIIGIFQIISELIS